MIQIKSSHLVGRKPKRALSAELQIAINRKAHELAAQSFGGIRSKLEIKAQELLADGHTPEDVFNVISLMTRLREEQ